MTVLSLLTILLVLPRISFSSLSSSCLTTVSNCISHTVCRYTCPADCPPNDSHASDSRILELNYRICSHPSIRNGGNIAIRRGSKTAEVISLFRKKRELQLIPQWQTEPIDTAVNMNSPFNLYCSVASTSSKAVYSWYHSTSFPDNLVETLTEPSTGDVNTKTGTLSFTKAATDHAGYYQCKMTDKVQDGTHSVYSNIVKVTISNNYLSVWKKTEEESVSQFRAQTIILLKCPVINSNPAATVTWYKDGSLYADQHGFVSPIDEDITLSGEIYSIKKDDLVLMDVTTALNGRYACRGTNPASGQYYDLKAYTVKIMSESVNDPIGPVIMKETSLEVDIGSPVTLYCPAVGVPSTITYTWTKNETSLNFDSRVVKKDFGRQIAITSALASDGGNYKCKAKNSNGESSTFFQLTTKKPTTPPAVSITRTPNVLYVHNKYKSIPGSIFIPCEVSGSTQTSFLRNGEALVKSNDYTFEEGKGLTFTAYNSSDSGMFQCVAFNSAYWKQKMTFVMITENVTAKATADVTLKDTNATLSCAASGYPYPDVTWTRDGTAMTNTDTSKSPYIINNPPMHQLIIKDIKFSDGGVYKCTAKSSTKGGNEAYEHIESSNVTLTIESKVVMIPYQTSVTATVNDTFELSCGAHGKPAPNEVLWYVNGTRIRSGDKYKITIVNFNDLVTTTSSLMISPLVIEDRGTYNCSASNTAAGIKTNATASIEMLVKYLKVSVTNTRIEITDGDPVTIVCSAEGSPTPDQIRWYIGSTTGTKIQNSGSYKITSKSSSDVYTSTLVVDKINANINFICEGLNYLENQAQMDTVKISVKIYSKVQAYRIRSSVTTTLGKEAKMTCGCKGVPLPKDLTWTKAGLKVFETDLIKKSNTFNYDPDYDLVSVMTFKSPVSSDIAKYTCTCVNEFQEKSYSSETFVEFLVVTPATIYWDSSNPLTAEFGKELRLTCTAKGLPKPERIVWNKASGSSNDLTDSRFSKDEKDLGIMSIQSVLIFSKTEYTDDGTYNCYADNKIDNVVHSRNANNTLLIYQKPSVTMNVQEYPIAQDGAATLTCSVAAKPPPTKITWSKAGKTLNGQNTITKDYLMTGDYTVDKVTSVTEGKYLCTGNNTSEGVPYSNTNYTWVRIYRASTLLLTSSVNENTINENTELNLTCTATGVPQVTDIRWTVDSELLTTNKITGEVGNVINNVDYESDINIKSTSVLAMKQVTYKNLGQYKCTTNQTWNGATRTLTQSRTIIVKFDVQLQSGKGSTEIIQDVGSTVHLQCDALGNPTPDDITWRWADGQVIGAGNTSTNTNSYKKSSFLQFSLLPQYHSKEIECVSKNTLSPTDKKLQFTLRINNNTMSILQSGKLATGETITLTCLTTFSSGAITWLKDDTKIVASSRYTFTTSTAYDTKNSVFSIKELISADEGNYTCRLVDGSTTASKNHILVIGSQVASTGMNTGIVIALIVLAVFIIIVIILLVVIFLHGRKSRGRSVFSEDKPHPTAYHNDAYLDHNVPAVITMPDTGLVHDDMPKVVEPIVLSNNVDEHDMKVATIARQATLTQQRPRDF